MSSHERALVSMISQLALSLDGAVLGVALAYAAVRTILRFKQTSTALRKIRAAPSVRVSDLRTLLEDSESDSNRESVIVVRGAVDATPSCDDRSWKSIKNNNMIIAQESGDKAVIYQRTQTYIYHEWRGFFGLTSDLRAILGRSWNRKESYSLMRKVPFVLVEGDYWAQSGCVNVNMDGSHHPLPLITVHHHLQPINASPYTFLQALFGHDYPVGLLDEEKILPLGKEITAVGVCNLNNGVPEIKSCKELPYFLSDKTKDQMLLDLAFNSKILMWSSIILGSLSIGILGFAFVRNWNKWKEWRLRRVRQSTNAATDDAASQIAMDEEAEDVPDGELCIICLMRRRQSAFIPCGHLVCCQLCAISVEREVVARCPVCRMSVRSSVRIYAS